MTDFRPAMLLVALSILMVLLALSPARGLAADADTPCFAIPEPGADPQSLAEGVDRDCSDIIAGLRSLLSPEPADTTTLISAFNNRANARQRLGDLEGAAEDFGQALDLAPASWMLHLNRGTLMILMNQPRAALADFQEAERLAGGRLPAASFNSTWAYRALGDVASAEASLRNSLSEARRPGSPGHPPR